MPAHDASTFRPWGGALNRRVMAVVFGTLTLTLIVVALVMLALPGNAGAFVRESRGRTTWRGFQFTNTHLGVNPYETQIGLTNVSTLTLAWSTELSGGMEEQPVVGTRYVYVGTNVTDSFGGGFYALNRATGKIVWQWHDPPGQGGAAFGLALSKDERVLYAGSVDALRAFDAATGTVLWTIPGGAGKPTLSHGAIYDGLGSTMYAVEAATGKHLWRLQTHGLISSAPAVAGGLIYFGSDETIFAVRTSDGSIVWTKRTSNLVFGSAT